MTQSGAAGAADRTGHVSALLPERGREERFGERLTGLSPAFARLELSERSCAILGFALPLLFKSGLVSLCVSSGFFKKIHSGRASAWGDPAPGLGERLNPPLPSRSSGSTGLRLLPWRINENVTSLGCGA